MGRERSPRLNTPRLRRGNSIQPAPATARTVATRAATRSDLRCDLAAVVAFAYDGHVNAFARNGFARVKGAQVGEYEYVSGAFDGLPPSAGRARRLPGPGMRVTKSVSCFTSAQRRQPFTGQRSDRRVPVPVDKASRH